MSFLSRLERVLEKLLQRREDEVEKMLKEMERLAKQSIDEQERILRRARARRAERTDWNMEEESVFPEEFFSH
jgi:Skp family chaperone for outer membrane proteins